MTRNLFSAVVTLMLASLVCMAQERAASSVAATPQTAGAKPASVEVEQLRKRVQQLSAENARLRARLAELEKRTQAMTLRDRLMQEEDRALKLQAQLLSIGEQEANVQSQLDQINEQLRPENIDNLQIYGSLRPEEVREVTRRKLTTQQRGILSQLQLIQQSRTRLQSSLTTTDILIQKLRQQLATALQQ
jgi:hypothetical protein